MRLYINYKLVAYTLLFFAVGIFLAQAAVAQQQGNTALSIERNKVDNTPTSIFFGPSEKWKDNQSDEIFHKYLGVDGRDITMVQAYSTTTKSNVTAKRYNEYYKGIQVEYGSYTLSCKNGFVTFITGNFYNADRSLSAVPVLSEKEAFADALKFVGADKYMWEDPREEQRIKNLFHNPDTSFKPKGVLRWVQDFNSGTGDRKLHLAYAFNIYAQSPLSRQIVYVDAATGRVLHANSLLRHTAATGHTKYSKAVPIETANLGATYELFDSTRGNGVHTLNMNNGSSYGSATEYTSVSNTWPVAVPDSIALDAHWAAEMVYDYWKNVQGRLSYDNADGILLQYVHYSSGYNNAFWDGMEMTYGDGTGCGSGFTALASLDVTGHEIGHGVCQYTANLVYASESGALNEGFSDCWGATIEAYADPHEVDAVPKSTWGIGEEIKCGNPMRRMDFPKLKSLPDTYGGTYWYNVTSCIPSGANDECGVHTNSGVLCKWYYLVAMGGSGTNDIGSTYSVTGIGLSEAANILYQTELVLSSTADYALTRTTAINTALTLYGACSPEVVAVTNAWYAVGVGAAYVPYPANITGSPNVCLGGTVSLSDATGGGTWSSSFTSIATVSATGVVGGVAVGVDTISYSMGGMCVAKDIVTVNALPASTITPAPAAIFCTGSSVTLTGNSGSGYTYQWQLGGSNIAGATTINYNASSAGNYNIIVSNAAGCSTTSAATVVSAVAPPPAVITPLSSTTFCSGSSVIMNASSGAGYTYQWLLGGSPIAGATTSSYTATLGGNYTVVVTNSSGCSTTSAATVVTINTSPTPLSGTTSVCAGLTTSLSDGVPGGAWTSSNAAIATVSSGTVTGVTPGTAAISYTLSSGCATSVVITVRPFPTGVLGSSTVCTGTVTTLSDAVSGGTWNSGATSIASITTAGVVSGISAGTADITYTLMPGCFTTTVITVNSSPTAILGTPSMCLGSTATLSDMTASGVWSSGSTAIATVGATGVVTGVRGGTTTISYTLSSGCTATATATVMTATASPIAGVRPGCVGQTTALTDATPGGVWSSSNPSIAAVGAGTGVVTGIATGSVTITYTAPTPCGTATVTTVMTIGVPQTPVVSVIANPGDTVCSGNIVTLIPIPVNGGSAPSYSWSVNGTFAHLGATYSYIPANGDRIVATMTSNYSCVTAATALSPALTLHTKSVAVNMISILTTNTTIVAGKADTFVAAAPAGGPTPSFQWYINTVAVPGATSGIFIISTLVTGDVVSCKVTTSDPCASPATAASNGIRVLVLPSGVQTVSSGMGGFTLAPNPNSGVFTIKGTLTDLAADHVNIRVANVLGQTVYTTAAQPHNGDISEQVTLPSNLVSGVYLVTIATGQEYVTFHVLLEK
jgi:Zn-dependent metalloprotease/uncharacterized protein YjdB